MPFSNPCLYAMPVMLMLLLPALVLCGAGAGAGSGEAESVFSLPTAFLSEVDRKERFEWSGHVGHGQVLVAGRERER
jgi:hypothetical protein